MKLLRSFAFFALVCCIAANSVSCSMIEFKPSSDQVDKEMAFLISEQVDALHPEIRAGLALNYPTAVCQPANAEAVLATLGHVRAAYLIGEDFLRPTGRMGIGVSTIAGLRYAGYTELYSSPAFVAAELLERGSKATSNVPSPVLMTMDEPCFAMMQELPSIQIERFEGAVARVADEGYSTIRMRRIGVAEARKALLDNKGFIYAIGRSSASIPVLAYNGSSAKSEASNSFAALRGLLVTVSGWAMNYPYVEEGRVMLMAGATKSDEVAVGQVVHFRNMISSGAGYLLRANVERRPVAYINQALISLTKADRPTDVVLLRLGSGFKTIYVTDMSRLPETQTGYGEYLCISDMDTLAGIRQPTQGVFLSPQEATFVPTEWAANTKAAASTRLCLTARACGYLLALAQAETPYYRMGRLSTFLTNQALAGRSVRLCAAEEVMPGFTENIDTSSDAVAYSTVLPLLFVAASIESEEISAAKSAAQMGFIQAGLAKCNLICGQMSLIAREMTDYYFDANPSPYEYSAQGYSYLSLLTAIKLLWKGEDVLLNMEPMIKPGDDTREDIP